MGRATEDAAFLAALEERIEEAEKTTAAELVVVLAGWSGSYADVDLRTAASGAFALLVFMVFAPFRVPEFVALLNVLASFAIVTFGSRRWPALRRLCTRSARLVRQVESQAKQVFVEESVHATKDRTGVLLYFSEHEGLARVVADLGIQGRMEMAPVHQIEAGFRAPNDPRSQLLEAVSSLGELLKHAVPAEGSNPDELSNRPRVRS